jgi:hypothetical protein
MDTDNGEEDVVDDLFYAGIVKLTYLTHKQQELEMKIG